MSRKLCAFGAIVLLLFCSCAALAADGGLTKEEQGAIVLPIVTRIGEISYKVKTAGDALVSSTRGGSPSNTRAKAVQARDAAQEAITSFEKIQRGMPDGLDASIMVDLNEGLSELKKAFTMQLSLSNKFLEESGKNDKAKLDMSQFQKREMHYIAGLQAIDRVIMALEDE